MIIKLIGVATGEPTPFDDSYLVDYGGEVEDSYGMGMLDVTGDREQAKRFPDAGEAMRFWKQVSKTIPVRPDGRPNRPLTAFTVEITKIGT